MFDFDLDWGYDNRNFTGMTKEYKEIEKRINDLCEQYNHFKRLPYGWYILPYFESYGIPSPPKKGCKDYQKKRKKYYLYTNFLKPNPNFYEFAEIYLEHMQSYAGARKNQEKYVLEMDRVAIKPKSCTGQSANYF